MKTTITLEKQILERIKSGKLHPTPKGYFKARAAFLWTLLGVFVAALSLGFGMIILRVKGADFGLFEKLGLSAYQKVAYSIPFFWIAATTALALVAFLNFRNTKRGYRTSGRHFILIAVLIAVALGSVLYASNVTEYIDDAASSVPLYNSVAPLNTHMWFDPDHGLLSGIVREKNSDTDFSLRDSALELWYITGTDIARPDGFQFHPGDRVKIIGTKIGDDTFRAVEIRPWE